jgi:hypothetical protein
VHAHPDFVHGKQCFQRQLTLPSGKTVVRGFKPGEVMWTDAHSHDIGENIGDTETHALIRRLGR